MERERSGFKNGRRYGTREGKQIIRTEAVIIYVGRDRASPQPRNKNCSPGQSPGGKFTSFPTLCILRNFPEGIATTRRRITTGYLEILLLSVLGQVQLQDITVDTSSPFNLIEIFYICITSRDRVDHFHRGCKMLKCIRNCFFFFFLLFFLFSKWENGKFKI